MSQKSTPPVHPVLVANPTASGHDRARALLQQQARTAQWPPIREIPTTPHDFGAAMTRQALAEGADLVIVGGGDGTVRTVAGELAGTGVSLAVLPLGTANIFARNLGLRPHRIAQAVEVAVHGNTRTIDLGQVHLDGDDHPQPFLVMAGVGHDADTIDQLSPGLKKTLGWPAYLEAGIRHLWDGPITMTVSADGGPAEQGKYWSLLLGNASSIPSGLKVFPDARLDDGGLSLLAVSAPALHRWVQVAASLVHRRLGGRAIHRRRVAWAELLLDDATLVQVDGDVHGPARRIRVDLSPAALAVRAPQPPRRVLSRRDPQIPQARTRKDSHDQAQ